MASTSWPVGPRTQYSPLTTHGSRSTGPRSSQRPSIATSPSGSRDTRASSSSTPRTRPSCPRPTCPSSSRYLASLLLFGGVIQRRIRHRRRAPKRGHMALFACFSYPDRGDVRVVYGVIAAFRRIPRGVVSRGQVRTRLRLPLSPAAFLDRLEKGIKTKDILLQHLPSSTGPKTFLWGSVPRPSSPLKFPIRPRPLGQVRRCNSQPRSAATSESC